MAKTEYIVFAEEITIGEASGTVYGIKCLKDGRVTAAASDITEDRAKIEAAVRLCTGLRLDPLQLADIAEDLAAEDFGT